MPVLELLGVMMIRGCGAVIARAGGVRSFSTIRANSGPVRYNPQQGARRERRDEAKVSQSRPLQRWKRVDKEFASRKPQEKSRYREDVERGEDEEESFTSAEMKLRDSSLISRERIRPGPEEQVESRDKAAPSFGGGLFYGDGRKFEDVKPLRQPEPLKKKNVGLFYGDGPKFEGVATPSASDLFGDPFIAAEDKLLESSDTEEDKAIAKEKEAAKNYALRLLAMAPQTAQKLRQKLVGRNVRESVIEATVADLQRCGLQSDLEYAEAFARSRWRSSLWGPQRLKQELRQRGVSLEDIQAALKTVFSTTDELQHEDEGGRWGMTREASAHLWAKATLQWRRGGSSLSREARKRRMVGWLQRRGFNWSITSEILKALEAQDGDGG